jgi:hypothetical protein
MGHSGCATVTIFTAMACINFFIDLGFLSNLLSISMHYIFIPAAVA